jgi:hypothetical protein
VSGSTLTLTPVKTGRPDCPVPGLLMRCVYSAPDGLWWVGSHVADQARVVVGPPGRLDVTGPGSLTDEHDAFLPRPFGALHRTVGTIAGEDVSGVIDQPGTRGFLKNLTAVSRERRKVRLLLDDGRCWWMRASGATAQTVTRADGSALAVGRTGADVDVEASAAPLEVAVALVLLTAVQREALLSVGAT